MKLVFDHIDFTVVGHMSSLLESAGIRTEIRNESGSGSAGEVPFTTVYPELWILDHPDEPRALAILREFRKNAASEPTAPGWSCPTCKEPVDGVFAECWNCSTPAPES